MIHRMKVIKSELCPTCFRLPLDPFRQYNERGKVTAGCVDHFHTGHLRTGSESARWHGRPEAKKIRAGMERMRSGCVSEAR
jgi:hypothetical protein